MWSVCPEARHNLCVCGGRQAYLELLSYCRSQAGDSCTHKHLHVYSYTHKVHIRWFPLTETDASQLTLKCVLSKSSEMPSSPHASPSHKRLQECPKSWHPHLQHAYHSDLSLEGKLMLFTMADCLNWLKQETCRHKYNRDLSNWVIW